MSVTPMMAQYLEIKAAHADALLFYRMGDFYEMFFQDAEDAAHALDIALTKRGKHDGEDIPMCGVPVHAAEGYLLTLIRKGFRVAVCEQMESPAEARKRGSKSVVKREVVRLVTPGTLTEDSLLEARRHNYLAAIHKVRDGLGLAWVDISTGAFHVMALLRSQLGPELARLAPAELLLSEKSEAGLEPLIRDMGIPLTTLSPSNFDSSGAEKRLCDLFRVSTLESFGSFSRAELGAMGALASYLDLTQRGRLPLLRPPQQETTRSAVQIDAATRRNLEVTKTMSGNRQGSLLHAIDATVTAGGARLLQRRISAPSFDLKTILARHDAVGFALEQQSWRTDMRAALRTVPDLDRALSRLSIDRAGPRDLVAIRTALSQARAAYERSGEMPGLLADAAARLIGHDTLIETLDAALIADPPLLVRDGGFIATQYDTALDEARMLRDEGKSVIAGMQQDYAKHTGISSLKIKYNNVLGYFIETTSTHSERMMSPPLSETFIHRQTTANQVRFTTVALSEIEAKLLKAGTQAVEIEKQLFQALREAVLESAAQISQTAQALAEMDVTCALAELAARENWCRPVIDKSRAFKIKNGRHPVVEAALIRESGAPFVANDCDLSSDDVTRICLLTGPNMAGKSTFLRQNALIAILAQMGSFVPADQAHIGLVSQIFSRVGASDDLARGRSTFMVEMVETAAILNQADENALVILDEIGRGTATYDGLSIAWATLEHLHDVNRARGLFATHYHEMTALASKLAGVENATMSVREWEGEIVFLHEVKKGAADRSYGIHVAQLAGLPSAVIARARVVLDALEQSERDGASGQKSLIDDLPLFSVRADAETKAQSEAISSAALDLLATVHPDDLSPKAALELIYQLKGLSEQYGS